LVLEALEPLRAIAECGTPVLIVPGNHERSAMPFGLLWSVPGVHVFDRPRTFRFSIRGTRVVLAGFPHSRAVMDQAFPKLVAQTGWDGYTGDIRLLCMHQVVQGAVVGAHHFTFRRGSQVVPGCRIPRAFGAVLAGHIHRHQVLTRDLTGKQLGCPVLYPGSTERTSFAERDEQKGYLMLELAGTHDGRGALRRCAFRQLPARPMATVPLAVGGRSGRQVKRRIAEILARMDAHSIVQLKVMGQVTEDALPVLRAASVRACAPASMNIEVAWPATGP
jgi:DNA repair exonuclease SbcCD nuclease subunit